MNLQYWISITLSFFRAVFVSFFHKDPQVNITQGILEGTTLESRNGRYFSSFTGIPFAQPPIGELRFRSPLPAKAWEGVFSANSDVDECPQLSKGKVQGKEDCLYLNVFTPLREFKISANSKLLPVMVYVPGGGYDSGSSSSFKYGPNYFLDKDIVLVSINYRLGILGFLTTGDSVAPGNFALKDQVLALKWVQKNIRAFGGDPNRVTLFGESSGGASVSLHALSDSSNGLFQQYIFQSGNALCPWTYRKKSDFKSDISQVAKNVGCPTNNSEVLIKCFRKINVKKLLSGTEFVMKKLPELTWTPTDELISEDAFLTDSPWNLITQNKMKDYPFISGTVADEGLYTTAQYYSKSASLPLKTTFKNSLNFIAKKYSAPQNRVKFNETIKDYYFKQATVSEMDDKFLQNLTQFISDSSFFYPEVILLDKVAEFAKSPFYFYRFGYQGDENLLELLYNIKKDIGIPHGAEIPFLFTIGPLHHVSKRDKYIIDVMVDFWTSFAINGIPNSVQLKHPDLWQPYVKSKGFLQIGNVTNNKIASVTFESNYFTDRMNFWKEHFPIPL